MPPLPYPATIRPSVPVPACLYWSFWRKPPDPDSEFDTIDLNPEDFLFLISGTYGSGSADGACSADDLDCIAHHDHLGMEAIRSLHQQLDDDDNGDIDLSESDDVSWIGISPI